MAYYSLGQQGWYNAWANAGQGIQRTLGDAMGIYNTYKPGGLEDQRRDELAMAKAKTTSDIGLQGAEQAGMTAEQQRAQELFDYQKGFRVNQAPQPDASAFNLGITPSAPTAPGQEEPLPTKSDSETAGDGSVTGSSPGYTAATNTPAAQPPTTAPQISSTPPGSRNSISIAADGTATSTPPGGQPQPVNLDPTAAAGLPGKAVTGPQIETPTPTAPGAVSAAPPAPASAAPTTSYNPFDVDWKNTEQAAVAHAPTGAVWASGAADTMKNLVTAVPHAAWEAGKYLLSPYGNPAPATATLPTAPASAAEPVPVSTTPPVERPTAPPAPAPAAPVAAPGTLAPVQPSQVTPGTTTVDPSIVNQPLLFSELPQTGERSQQAWLAQYRAANPLGPNGLPTTVVDAQQAFDNQARAETGTLRRQATEEDLMNALRLGIDPSTYIHNSVLDPLAEVRALVPAYQRMIGGGGTGLWRLNPGTGKLEPTPEGLQTSPVDPSLNRLDTAMLDKVGYDYRQNKAVSEYTAVSVPYNGMLNIAKQAGAQKRPTTNAEDNDFISFAARVQNPNAVVRPSAVDFEQEKSGWGNEYIRYWKQLHAHGGKLTDQDRHDMLEAAGATYSGLQSQMQDARNIAMSQAQFALDKGANPARVENYTLGKPVNNLNDQTAESPTAGTVRTDTQGNKWSLVNGQWKKL